MERRAAHALGDQGEHDVAAVAVGELRRRERISADGRRGRRGSPRSSRARARGPASGSRSGPCPRPRRGSPDARAVREQVLDRHTVVDQRQIAAEHGTRRRRQLEQPVLDQADDRQRRQALRSARGRRTACRPRWGSRARGARSRTPSPARSGLPRSTRTTPENAVSCTRLSSSLSSPVILDLLAPADRVPDPHGPGVDHAGVHASQALPPAILRVDEAGRVGAKRAVNFAQPVCGAALTSITAEPTSSRVPAGSVSSARSRSTYS